MFSVLFVCTGNQCRSPLAEALFRDVVARRGWRVQAGSVGTVAGDGRPAHEHARAAARAAGLSLEDFRTRELTLDRLAAADLIVGLSASHVDQVNALAPALRARTLTLLSVTGSAADVADPLRRGPKAFAACLAGLRPAIEALADYVGTLCKAREREGMRDIVDFTLAPYRLFIGSDHGGFELKNALAAWLRATGREVTDVGPAALDPDDDYPDYAVPVARAVAADPAAAGLLICRSGIGMSLSANRFHHVRAALVRTADDARMSRSHNCANVLVTGGDGCALAETQAVIEAWLATPFSGEARHRRRLQKLETLATDDQAALRPVDPELAAAIDREAARQRDIIELIASENMVSPAVRAAAGSCLTNKYAEGYPGRRYYGGCECVDDVERLAIERACRLFGAEAANVQPHSGSQANMAVYFALLEPGDTVLAMSLAHGGHLTHGLNVNFSGRLFNFVSYGVNRQTERLDYGEIQALAKKHRPKLLLAGASAYPRFMDYAKLRQIADSVGARLVVDMAHVAGLVAAGVHPNPVPHCDAVTSTTHKTLRGPRAGLILCRAEHAKAINAQIFPGIQGGPLLHLIAAKAVCFHEAAQPAFKVYAEQVRRNATALADALAARGFRIVSGGTDNHLLLVDLRPLHTTGKAAEVALDRAGITTNKNLIPFDPEKPAVASGLRLGTPTVTTRGMKETEMVRLAEWIQRVISRPDDAATAAAVRQEVCELTSRFPVP